MASNMQISTADNGTGDWPFRMIGGFAASCFIGALMSDIVYARDPNYVWSRFSVWAITIGLIAAGIAALIGLIDRLVHGRFRTLGSQWPYLLGFAAVVVVETFNAFVHSRDAYESVVPDGIALSAVAVVLLALTLLFGRVYSRSRTRRTSL